MTPEVENLDKQKNQIFNDVFDNKIPERVPIRFGLHTNVIAGYAGIHGAEAIWNPSLLLNTVLELADRIPSDTVLYSGSILAPVYYQAVDSASKKISKDGFMQHMNGTILYPEEYDEFIKNPYDCIVEIVLPRLYNDLDFRKDPARAMMALFLYEQARLKHIGKDRVISQAVKEKYGGWSAAPGTQIGCPAPLDLVGDNLRGLNGIVVDMRRIPEKVEAALEALYPLNYLAGIPSRITSSSSTSFNYHTPTYLREKDFERFFWKPFLRQANDYASMGIHSAIFLEHDWMNRLDYLLDLPTNTRLQFERLDPKPVKEKLGKKFILQQGFPLETLRLYNKEECIGKVKDFLDIMLPGGNYVFGFDKNALCIGDVNMDNLQAILETVRDYGVYKNAGEKTGIEFKKEDYKHSEIPSFTSKYFRTWEKYKELSPLTPESARKEVMDLEESMVKYIYALLR